MSNRSRHFILFLLLSYLFFLTGCGPVKEKHPNIVLISIDSLRQDHVSCYGYSLATTPTLDKLAQEGFRFETSLTPAPWTLPAHMSVMTGLPPSLHQVEERGEALPKEINTLAQVLKKQKYKTFGLATVGLLSEGYGFDRGFDYYEVRADTTAEAITKKAIQLLSQIDIKNESFFLFLHYFDVHWPYHPPEKFASMFGANPQDSKYGDWQFLKQFSYPENPLSPEIKDKITALYDGEIRFTDEQIKIVLQHLKDNGIFDDTIVVVFSDHGEEFKEHDSFGHGHSFYREVIDVPLIIRYSPLRKTNVTISEPVVTSDIALTLLKLAKIVPPQQFGANAEDLLRDAGKTNKRSNEERSIILETTERGPKRLAILKRNYKYIAPYVYNAYRYQEGDEKKWYNCPEGLYNLSQDPFERVNILEKKQQVTSILKAELRKYMSQTDDSLQLWFFPSPHQKEEYHGMIAFDSTLMDEPYGINMDDSDFMSPIEKTDRIKFSFAVDRQQKILLFNLSSKTKKIRAEIYRNKKLYFEKSMNLPNPGEVILLGGESLEKGGCAIKGSTFYLQRLRSKAKLTQEQIEQLKSLGYF